ncbi:MAG: multidrug transporter permease [Gammaproteobacteria bacterium]|jgi:O-acetylserine/cysteine efflux transporter|nr:multidrug transporter permease [Gammaproteobacteria bacterium]
MPFFDVLLTTLAAMLWGFNYLAIKVGVAAFSPIYAMVLRFIIVSAVLAPWIIRTPKDKLWPLFKLSVIMGTIYFSLFFIGTAGVPAGEAAIIMQLQVPIAAIISTFVFKEKLSFKVFTGIVIAMVGVIVTIGMPQHAESFKPIIYLVFAALFWALGNIQAKKIGDMHPFVLNGTMALFAAPQLFILTLIFEPSAFASIKHANLEDFGALLYMALISNIVCYSIWFKMLQRHAVNKVMPFNLLVPIVAVISADLFAHEVISLHVLIGCILCVFGLSLVLIKRHPSKPKLAVEES